MRGTGNSEGRLIPYEYSDQENDDGEVVIDWLSQQAWSNGNVGMFGISWGGFNAIHLAMRNPPALKAIIAVDATDDLYQDDVHFMDGVMHVDSWEMSRTSTTPAQALRNTGSTRPYFRDRFDTEPWMMTYKRQQRDGPFWDRTSLKVRYDSIRVPTFVIGGWYDGYRDSVPRMLEHLQAPIKAIVGAWHHSFPHNAYPKPQIEWRHEAVRWFDHWLKGSDTGILEEPRFAVYVRQWHPPGPYLEEAPGEWRWEEGWPVERIEERVLYPQPNHTLGPYELGGDDPPPPLRAVDRHRSWWLRSCGGATSPTTSGRPTPSVWSMTAIRSRSRSRSSGLPKALLTVSADAPQANWFVRLSDVAPDGTVTQVAGAGFNGTHRESAREPKPLEPGEAFPLEIEMHFTSWVFPVGHRIRLAVANAQWPMLWPTPYPMTTSLYLGGDDGSQLLLPVVPYEDRPAPAFLPPEEDPVIAAYESLDEGTTSGYGEISSVDRNPQTGTVKVEATNGGGTRYPWGIERYGETIIHETSDEQPEKTSVRGEHWTEVELEDRT